MTERLYRVRRTVLQMLRDRGYDVHLAEIDEPEESFRERFSQTANNREALTLLVTKKDNPTDQIFVFWPSDPKIGVKPVRRCCCAPAHAQEPAPSPSPPLCPCACTGRVAGSPFLLDRKSQNHECTLAGISRR